MSQPTDEQIARLMAASPDIRPLCIEQAANQVDVIAAMARTWIMNGDDQHGAALQNLCIAFGFQRTEIERLRVENANLRARRNDVRDWAMRNEIAAPPLDWAGLGRILDNPSDLAAPVPVDQPKCEHGDERAHLFGGGDHYLACPGPGVHGEEQQ